MKNSSKDRIQKCCKLFNYYKNPFVCTKPLKICKQYIIYGHDEKQTKKCVSVVIYDSNISCIERHSNMFSSACKQTSWYQHFNIKVNVRTFVHRDKTLTTAGRSWWCRKILEIPLISHQNPYILDDLLCIRRTKKWCCLQSHLANRSIYTETSFMSIRSTITKVRNRLLFV